MLLLMQLSAVIINLENDTMFPFHSAICQEIILKIETASEALNIRLQFCHARKLYQKCSKMQIWPWWWVYLRGTLFSVSV